MGTGMASAGSWGIKEFQNMESGRSEEASPRTIPHHPLQGDNSRLIRTRHQGTPFLLRDNRDTGFTDRKIPEGL